MSIASGKRRTSVTAIFLTVFLDLLSFGLFIPDLQLRGKELAGKFLGASASPAQIGFLTGLTLASFSLAQLITSPILGRLSDRIGRRKILLLTTLLSTAAYVVYAHVTTVEWVIASRALSGIAAANLGVAFAYVADVTRAEDRAKSLGTIGAAFGLGFIFGPVAGAFLLGRSGNNPLVLGYVGAGLAFVNFLYVYFMLGESLTASKDAQAHFFHDVKTAFRTPGLSLMLVMFFALNFGFTNLESTFFQLLETPTWIFHQGVHARETGGYILGLVGVVAVIMQGFVIRLATPRFGEVKLLRFSYLGYLPALALIPWEPLWAPMILGIVALGIFSGLAQPSLSSLISRAAPKSVQGGIFGITQALGALARCVGPLVSNPLFAWKAPAPYIFGAIVILFPAVAVWKLREPAKGEDHGVIPAH